MKIALLQCTTTAGDITGNARRIAEASRRAAQDGVVMCVTPESALCGVGARALLLADGFLEGCRTALHALASELAGGPAVLVGAPVSNPAPWGRRISNAAVLLHNGVCSVVTRKIFTSTGDDARYYEPGVTCGVVSLGGWRFGIVLCADIGRDHSFWTTHQSESLRDLMSRGADGIIHMTAWPLVLETQSQRERAFSHMAARHHIHVLSVNTVGCDDGNIYAGQSVAFGPTGALLARGRAFAQDIVLVDTAAPPVPAPRLSSCVEEECWRALVLGTEDFIRKSGAQRVVIGLSGGLDSALVAAVAVQALGAANVRGVFLPSPYTSDISRNYVHALSKNLGIACDTVDISPIMTATHTSLDPLLHTIAPHKDDVTAENIQSRLRGLALMAVANREGSLVLGTGNKSEAAMGYCTLYGDAIGALSVLGDVPKTLVAAVARWYNGQYPNAAIPMGILDREPTAELKPHQRDSDSLPPYATLDPALDTVLGQFAEDNPPTQGETNTFLQNIFARLRHSEFKRRQMPPVLRLTDRPLCGDWALPLLSRWNMPEADSLTNSTGDADIDKAAGDTPQRQ